MYPRNTNDNKYYGGWSEKMVSKKIYNRRKLSEDNYNGNNKRCKLYNESYLL